MLDPNSTILAHLVRELATDPVARRTLETLATSYALRADVPGAAFLSACGMGPLDPMAHVSAWPAPRESHASFSAPGNLQNIPRTAANRADPGNPTGAPGDAPEAAEKIAPAISPCEKSKCFRGDRYSPQPYMAEALGKTSGPGSTAVRVVAWPKL